MPRAPRPTCPGLIFHVFNRGNGRQSVFSDREDYLAFLAALGDLKSRRPFRLYGYCLMPNHVHLLIQPVDTTISRILQSLLTSHSIRYHRRRGTCGHVWQGRFKSPVIQGDSHLLRVLRYIEANPVRAGLVRLPEEYVWSSYAVHAFGKHDPLVDSLGEYEELGDSPRARQEAWRRYMGEEATRDELTAIRRSATSGLPYGDAEWVERVLIESGIPFSPRGRGRPPKTERQKGPSEGAASEDQGAPEKWGQTRD